jgi:hypothetical protein
MTGMALPLSYLMIATGAATFVLATLVIYGNTLSMREGEQIILNKVDDVMIGSPQRLLVERMNHLKTVIIILAVIAGTLVLASAGVWVWIGLTR